MASNYDRVPRGIAQYGIGEWDQAFGNHRAVLRVQQAGEAVTAWLPWRRRDAFPQARHVWIEDGQTGLRLANSVVVSCNREYGEVVFEPASGPGTYYAYYLSPNPDQHRWEWPRWAFPVSQYEAPHTTADPAWLDRQHLRPDSPDSLPNPPGSFQNPDCFPARWRDLPAAELVEFQSRGAWDSFYPMEVIATLEEQQGLFARCGERPFLLFPESRFRPIRMNHDIPYHWAVREPAGLDSFQETACRGEYLVFQVGVLAHRQLLANLSVTASALRGPAGAVLPAGGLTCFNLEGRDQRGRPFTKTLHLPRGQVQALWFGLDIPQDARPGLYEGSLSVGAQGLPAQVVRIQLTLEERVLADRGDSDGARLSRLAWLNSDHALDDEVCPPYLPVRVKGRVAEVLGRSLELGQDGLLARATSFIDMFAIGEQGRQVLASPLRLDAVRDGQPVTWQVDQAARCRKRTPAWARFAARQSAPDLTRRSVVTVEMDGRVGVRIELEAAQDLTLDGLRLVLELPAAVSRLWLEPTPPPWVDATTKRPSCVCPTALEKSLSGFQSVWVGDYNAGLGLSIPAAPGHPFASANGRLRQALAGGVCRIELDSGALALQAGRPLLLEFALYVTPFKPLPREHWDWRYCHQGYGLDLDLEDGIRAGARVFIQHQGSPITPYISYLFPQAEALKRQADRVHQAGGRYKAYNTIRELSTRADELWALRSLGDEILSPSVAQLGFESLAQLPLEYQLRDLVNEPFNGQLWMCEHLVDNYHSRWHSPIRAQDGSLLAEDSSLQISGASRWSNFYIEGLRWLMENAGVDGLYLDGVTFDRDSFLRVRKTLVRQKPEALIDFHGTAVEVLDFLGFIDSLWFGEGADYSREEAYWLAAVSGIPFGIPGEMLLPEASVQRGMLYGLSQRYAWMPFEQVNPAALWAWWDRFDIRAADMLGYWMPACPVRSSHPAVKATVYRHTGRRAAIAVASWAEAPVSVRLEIDWAALGLDPATVRVSVPEIALFQPALAPVSLESLPLEPNRGWIVVLEG